MSIMTQFLLWCILLVLYWPLAMLVLAVLAFYLIVRKWRDG
jgi:uncharacterized membrane protein YhaH (DUF805 family)